MATTSAGPSPQCNRSVLTVSSGFKGLNHGLGKSLTHILVYLTTTGHKSIGILYGYSGYLGGLLGFYFSILIRGELAFPGLPILRKVKEISIYNHWITVHGLIMLFLFVMPVAIGFYGNFLLPLLIGASELSMPRMNGTSFWMLCAAGSLFLMADLLMDKPVASGWTLYPPLSTRDAENSGVSTDFAILTIHLLGASSGLGSFNYISTSKHQRHLGLSLLASGIFVWAILITSLLLVGALPILGVAVTGLLLDRNLATSIYDGIASGDPVLYQHIFWFFGHPEVYVIILPIFGLVSTILTSITHKDLFGRSGMIYCMSAIGVVGYFVWSHHMFTVGLDVDSRAYFSAATAVISIPTAVKVFSYIATWASGRGPKGSSITWAFWSFLICFTSGGFSGLILSSASLDLILHDTYFVVGHFHTVLSLGAVFGLFVAHYYFHPTFLAISVFESYAMYHVLILLIGAIGVFYPMHLAGLAGMARRVPEFADFFLPLVTAGTSGTFLLILSVFIFLRASFLSWSSILWASYL